MIEPKIQDLQSLREQMKAAARGEEVDLEEAAKPSFNSVNALFRLLTPENRRLLALIRDHEPDSVAQLALLSGRSQPNLTRTLGKLTQAGFIEMRQNGRRKMPVAMVSRIHVEIDPYSEEDQLTFA
jgi:predicted transcriptional regulator